VVQRSRHLAAKDDELVTVRPVLDRIADFADFLSPDPHDDFAELRRSEGTGRPIGASDFVAGLERILGRRIARRAPGRKPELKPTGEQLELL
jgi:putative transposase